MMEREQTNETQISKSLNLKSKSKPISFQPINKEKEQRGTLRDRERTNLLVESENDERRRTPKRERRLSKRRNGVGERLNSVILYLDCPFYPHEIFFNLSLKSSSLDSAFNRSRVLYTRLPGGFFFFILIHVSLYICGGGC